MFQILEKLNHLIIPNKLDWLVLLVIIVTFNFLFSFLLQNKFMIFDYTIVFRL
jgi:hypothetical protein